MSDTNNNPAPKSQFEGLIAALGEDLAKALPAADDTAKDDAAIAAAAAEGDKEGDKEEPEAAPAPAEVEDDKPAMAKSFKITLDDGTEIDAIDGADLVKSLMARIEGSEAAMAAFAQQAVAVNTAQGELIKSLQGQVAELANQGRGRKGVVTLMDKPAATAETLAKSEAPTGVSGDEFLTKALAAQAAGKISGLDVSIAEQDIAAGRQPDPRIVTAVLG